MRIRVEHDRSKHSLTIWFGDPHDERTRAPAADVILIMDAAGSVIGLEKQGVTPSPVTGVDVHVETISRQSL
jgi:hypothetical protein